MKLRFDETRGLMGFDVEAYESSVLEAAYEASNGTRTKIHHGVCGQVPDELMNYGISISDW